MNIKEFEGELISSFTHGIGALMSIAALVILIIYASINGTAVHVVSFAIFGASLILLYVASTCYHLTSPLKKSKGILKKIDHSMIYILIAGTYTPICLVLLGGGWGWSLFGVTWGLAVTGVLLKTVTPNVKGVWSTLSYLLLGWVVIIAFFPLIRLMPEGGLFWLVFGGLSYSAGTIFFGLDAKYSHKKIVTWHDVFHIFVMIGSFSHFWLMIRYITYV